MAFRPELKPYQVVTNGDLSASFNSLVTIIQKLSLVSYTFNWNQGSSPIGTLSVQVSNDYSIGPTGAVVNAGNWSSISFLNGTATAKSLALSSNSGNDNITLPLCGAYAIRLSFASTSGSGTFQAWICAKVS